MATLIARGGIIAALFVGCGLLAHQAIAKPVSRNEAWLEDVCPTTVAGARMEVGPTGSSRFTYKMDKTTYEELKPFGIVARIFTVNHNTVDTVVIASNDKESFHDPRVCFTAQGWTIEKESEATVQTKSGPVKVTLARLGGRGDSSAVFLYKGPKGYVASTTDVKMDLFLDKLVNRRSSDGIFYRFIRTSPSMSEADFMKFIGQYLDSAQASSKGYL